MVRAYLDLTASGLKGIDIGDGWTQLPVSAKSGLLGVADVALNAGHNGGLKPSGGRRPRTDATC